MKNITAVKFDTEVICSKFQQHARDERVHFCKFWNEENHFYGKK